MKRMRDDKVLELVKKGYTEQQAENILDGPNEDDQEIEFILDMVWGILLLIAIVAFLIVKLNGKEGFAWTSYLWLWQQCRFLFSTLF